MSDTPIGGLVSRRPADDMHLADAVYVIERPVMTWATLSASITDYREANDRSPVILVNPATANDIASMCLPSRVHVMWGPCLGKCNLPDELFDVELMPCLIVDECAVFAVVGMVDGILCVDAAGYADHVRLSADGTFLVFREEMKRDATQ
jgi:hypothetical protein